MIQSLSSDDLAPTPYAWPVQAENLGVRAGRRLVVTGVDLTLGVGVHGVLGPNGAGKTTLLRALATVLAPAEGRLELLGEAVSERGDLSAVRRGLGYLPQKFGYYRRYTVREFLEYLAWLKSAPLQDIPAEVQRVIDRVGLSDQADRRMKTLSGGMIRRAGLAQALIGDPALLVLDEPTVGLDPQNRAEIRRLIHGLGRTSCVVMATHLIDDLAEDLADDSAGIVVMDGGRVTFQGPIEDVRTAGRAGTGAGGNELERGYTALLKAHRKAN